LLLTEWTSGHVPDLAVLELMFTQFPLQVPQPSEVSWALQ
jgi:hypothetical protein